MLTASREAPSFQRWGSGALGKWRTELELAHACVSRGSRIRTRTHSCVYSHFHCTVLCVGLRKWRLRGRPLTKPAWTLAPNKKSWNACLSLIIQNRWCLFNTPNIKTCQWICAGIPSNHLRKGHTPFYLKEMPLGAGENMQESPLTENWMKPTDCRKSGEKPAREQGTCTHECLVLWSQQEGTGQTLSLLPLLESTSP